MTYQSLSTLAYGQDITLDSSAFDIYYFECQTYRFCIITAYYVILLLLAYYVIILLILLFMYGRMNCVTHTVLINL